MQWSPFHSVALYRDHRYLLCHWTIDGKLINYSHSMKVFKTDNPLIHIKPSPQQPDIVIRNRERPSRPTILIPFERKAQNRMDLSSCQCLIPDLFPFRRDRSDPSESRSAPEALPERIETTLRTIIAFPLAKIEESGGLPQNIHFHAEWQQLCAAPVCYTYKLAVPAAQPDVGHG